MYTAQDFSQAFDDYARFHRELMQNISPMGGIVGVLGFGKRPGDDPGHQKFLNEMDDALKNVVAGEPDPDTAGAVMDVIFQARYNYDGDQISPYLFSAVEGMTLDLIPFLSVEKTREIYETYQRLPRTLRVPVVKKVLAALKENMN